MTVEQILNTSSEKEVIPPTEEIKKRYTIHLKKLIKRLDSNWTIQQALSQIYPLFRIWNEEQSEPWPLLELWAMFDKVVTKIYIPNRDELKKTFASNTKQGIHNIAKYLVNRYKFIAVADKESYELYVYKKGVYVEMGMALVEREVEKILGELSTVHCLREINKKIKRMTSIDRDDFNDEKDDLICVNNGLLNIKTRELIPHNSKFIFTSKILIDYNPKAKCPLIKKFMLEVLYPEHIKVVQEWFGFSLLRDYKYKKAMIFFGENDTGKTTLTNLLRVFIGEKNCSSLGLYKLATNSFACYDLYKKLVNTCDDLAFRDISDIGQFKSAIGKGSLNIERKFCDPFSFYNYAKMLFNCNKIPLLTGPNANDKAYFTRWLAIPCDNVFKKENMDSGLTAKISAPEELSGLLNYALDGLDRLLKNDKFSYDKDWHETKLIMERSGSPIAMFAQDELREKTGAWVSTEDIYNTYNRYTVKNKLPSITETKLSQQISNYAFYLIRGKDKAGDKRGFRNVELVNSPPTDFSITPDSSNPPTLNLSSKPVFGDPDSGKLPSANNLSVKK